MFVHDNYAVNIGKIE